MKRLLKLFAALLILSLLYLSFWPVPIDPIVWTPSPDPGFSGAFSANQQLAAAKRHQPELGHGPEDVTLGPDGYLYTGLQDGRVVRFRPDQPDAETFVNTGGRPLGLGFDREGNLIVADAFKGLLSVDIKGGITVLVDNIDGKPMLFTDDLDIASDGVIWFSDASQRFDQHNYMMDFLEGRSTGRLLSHNPATGRTEVHLDGLHFANGVALGPDETYLLINETYSARIIRYWIQGPKAGTSETFIDQLPGYPDNLSYNGDGVFWVAIPAPRATPLEKLSDVPFMRKVSARLPQWFRDSQVKKMGWVLGLSPDGEVLYNLQDTTSGLRTITSVNEFEGQLYLGSLAMESIAYLPRP